MRPDKTTLAAVAATLALYRSGRALLDIPVWRAIATTCEELARRARALAGRAGGDIVELSSTVGGGSLPGETLPSVGLRFGQGSARRLSERLRRGDPCVIARIEGGAVIVDLRTAMPERDDDLGLALKDTWRHLRVAQCGYCQTGQVMAANALLRHHPEPDIETINNAMSSHVCRCGSYQRIREAISLAAEQLTEGRES